MVSLVAVEECLNEVTDMDCECCVVELPDAKRGSKIVAVTSKEVDSSKTNKRLADELPNIALPRKYVTVSSFPRMGSGKTDFRGLTDYVWKLEQKDD
jgi:acyl-[acyl-carrier-protein]-phospholipid O-acyltransferase/long-chain-fatty-acid--[acyl-carrier-protein] ligase